MGEIIRNIVKNSVEKRKDVYHNSNLITNNDDTKNYLIKNKIEYEDLNYDYDIKGGEDVYSFKAVLTERKKQELINKGITILNEEDSKNNIIEWNDSIWHYDIESEEFEEMQPEDFEENKIYFIRKNENSMVEEELNYEDIFNSISTAIKVLKEARKKINQLRDGSQSE